MIPDLDLYQGAVLRQLLVAQQRRIRIGVADLTGRTDSFFFDRAAFQIKHSSKRLSPWHFTYSTENLAELSTLRRHYNPVWLFLVCGKDGVVGLSLGEFKSITQVGKAGAAWVRVSRSRNSMYRVGGALGDLPRAKARGVQEFLAAASDLKGDTEGK